MIRVDVGRMTPRDCWPDPTQLNLLRAALWTGPEAVKAWELWRPAVQLEALDFSSWKLLPMVYRNLGRQGYDDPLWETCRGLYRYHWARTERILFEGWKLVGELEQEGISTLVLKGAALAQQGVIRIGERAMGDFDVLVPEEAFLPLVRRFLDKGWSLKPGESLDLFNLRTRPSLGLERADRFHFDLHGHVLHRHCADDHFFWEGAVPLRHGEIMSRSLNPADMVLHLVNHGMQWSPHPPFRWMVDLWHLLHTENMPVDWSRLVEQSSRFEATEAMRRGLRLFQEELRGPVPEEILKDLEQRKITGSERRWFQALEVNRVHHLKWRMYHSWKNHRLAYPGQSSLRRLFTFFDENRRQLGLGWGKYLWKIVTVIRRRAAREAKSR